MDFFSEEWQRALVEQWPRAARLFGCMNSNLHERRTCSIELLKSWLSDKQLAEYECAGAFHVVGQSGRLYYVTDPSVPYNVRAVEEELDICFLPKDIPSNLVGDIMLAQKTALETDEAAVIAVANVRMRKAEPHEYDSVSTPARPLLHPIPFAEF